MKVAQTAVRAVFCNEGSWSFDSNVLYTLSTEGTQSTVLGDRFQYNFAVSYRLTALGSGEHPMFHGAEAHEEGDDGHQTRARATRVRDHRST